MRRPTRFWAARRDSPVSRHRRAPSRGNRTGPLGGFPPPLRRSVLVLSAYVTKMGRSLVPADLRLIQDYLGHRDPKHTVRYTRVAGYRFEGLWRA
jgi:integrase